MKAQKSEKKKMFRAQTLKIPLQFQNVGNFINTHIVGVHGKPAKYILVEEMRFLNYETLMTSKIM
jgi:hypothetical protein